MTVMSKTFTFEFYQFIKNAKFFEKLLLPHTHTYVSYEKVKN